MPTKTAVLTTEAPAPLPVFSQAIVHNGMLYCSGSIGMDPKTNELVPGGVAERTDQALKNLVAVLEAGGSSLRNVVKTNVFIATMDDFAEMNKVYQTYFKDEPKPCRTCVAVKQLPLDTDVEIECIAYLYEASL
ncbi:yabJ protein [Nannizzia gypsea CBS 118893]|uniref:YabJ protein n=1 Tax=Arthroderma gypseum (strain ATCC MYA-4604 / CBS 118893) TaxID=535722 RepID=E4V1Z0_ARTGP|nr:yabJ protein [Nannizzia gypsea CBS 118893]EFR04055.1 yabJ protein [Nannizzia gypsea CBS 118893]